MKWWLTAWPVLRDVLLTGTGLWLIISQVGTHDPNSALIVAGLALTVPAAATHAGVLSGSPDTPHGPPSSSESSSPPASLPSSPPGSSGEGGAG